MIQRVLITQYSIGGIQSPVQRWQSREGLFAKDRLDHRFELFEMATFPSVLAQSDQQFVWLIAIDPKLPAIYRVQLEALVALRPGTFLVEIGARTKLWRGQWLRPWLNENSGPIATILLDDDDALPMTFMAALSERLKVALRESKNASFLRVYGFFKPWQWDLRPTIDAPLGQCSTWHRRRRGQRAYPPACGLTLFVSSPQYDISVLALLHVTCADNFDANAVLTDRLARNARRLLRAAATVAGDDWHRWSIEANFQSLDDLPDVPVILNHRFNDQVRRLSETKPDARPVASAATFAAVGFDWPLVQRYIRKVGHT